MALAPPMSRWLRYLLALLMSAAALILVAVAEPWVGFVPLLLLPAVALAENYLGAGPAALIVILSTLGSINFLSGHPMADVWVRNVTELALFPPVAFSVLYLMAARRKQRRVVREQLLELSTLLDSMPEAVLIFSRDGRVMDANRAAEQLCACGVRGLQGRYYTEIATLLDVQRDEKPIPPAEMAVARALRGETTRAESRTVVHPSDRIQLNMVISTSPMHSDDGRIIGALLVVRDVTELTHLQRRIADTERHLAIGQMASGIAHDFNNVLNTITQAVAVLALEPDRPFGERRVYLDMIDRAARTGAEIIKRVREYIRGGTGEQTPLRIPDLLHQAVDLTEPMWRKRTDIKLTTNFRPVSLVQANGPDLQRVFANLIINAIQAMPAGGALNIECEERDNRVLVRVRDTGIGIPSDQQRKIFMPYFTTKPQGTGLGLSTAQRTVLALGGNISFSSDAGSGSTFTLELPALASEKIAA